MIARGTTDYQILSVKKRADKTERNLNFSIVPFLYLVKLYDELFMGSEARHSNLIAYLLRNLFYTQITSCMCNFLIIAHVRAHRRDLQGPHRE